MCVLSRNYFPTISFFYQGWTTYQARKIAGISIRRVNQVYGQYLISGEIPEIGIKNGRPKKPKKNLSHGIMS